MKKRMEQEDNASWGEGRDLEREKDGTQEKTDKWKNEGRKER